LIGRVTGAEPISVEPGDLLHPVIEILESVPLEAVA